MSEFSSSGCCLCGAVRFHIKAQAADVGLCHCKMCRRWSGGLPYAAMQAQVTLEKDDTLAWWQSSGWGERGFCTCCGTPLFWRLQGQEAAGWVVSAGALEEEAPLKIVQHIFYDDKAPFYETADEAARLSGAEFTAGVMKALAAQHGEEAMQQALAQLRQHSPQAFVSAVKELL